MLTQVVGRQNGTGTLRGSDGICAPDGRVSAIQVCGLDLRIANALLSGQPILPGEQGGVRVGERTATRDKSQADELSIDRLRFWKPCRPNRDCGYYGRADRNDAAGGVWRLGRERDASQRHHGKHSEYDPLQGLCPFDRVRCEGVLRSVVFVGTVGHVLKISPDPPVHNRKSVMVPHQKLVTCSNHPFGPFGLSTFPLLWNPRDGISATCPWT